jgi:glycosyltransferase involved in cell wall biosynthesis
VGDRRLRVVRIIARLNIGGPARHVALLQRHLAERGYQSTLVTGVAASGEAELPPDEAAGAPIDRIVVPELGRSLRAADDLVAFGRIVGLLRRLEPDIVHTHTAKAGALGRVAASFYNATRRPSRRAVVVHTFHGHVMQGYFGPVASRAVRAAERALARMSDRIVAISSTQRRDLVEVFRIAPARKVVVVPLGLDLDQLQHAPDRDGSLRREAGFPGDAIVCGYVGRLVPIKHVDLLIRAFAEVQRRQPRARLLVVGDGECRVDLERLVGDLSLTGLVCFAGWRTDVVAVYGALDIVALSSRNEGTPVALIEAGAAGKAIVATRVGGVPDVVETERTGLLVPDDDLAALASAIERLIVDTALRARLGSSARESSIGRFGYRRLVDDLDRVYHVALHVRRGGVPLSKPVG